MSESSTLPPAIRLAAVARDQRRERAARLAENPDLASHGSASTYSNWGCRCPDCTAAHSQRMHDHYRGWAT